MSAFHTQDNITECILQQFQNVVIYESEITVKVFVFNGAEG